MAEPVSTERIGNVAIVEIDNPPVNALGSLIRQHLEDHVRAALEDDGVDAVVLAARGKHFSGGADIREFGQPSTGPDLPGLIARLEAADKPIVAALKGTVFGGGFELALGCHYRIADSSARFALPEVRLGLLPGAGGTQRLTRLIGPEAAVKLIVTGEPIDAREALSLGIVDRLDDGDPREAAIAFAGEIAKTRPLPRVSEMTDRIAAVDPVAFDAVAERFLAANRGLTAPRACVASVRNAFTRPFAEGLAEERRMFAELRGSDESRAQRHLFFAERAALKVPGLDATVKPRPVQKIAVIGAGTMGGGIAMSLASGGYDVTIVDQSDDALTARLQAIAGLYRKSAARGASAAEGETALARISSTTDFAAAVGGADLVIEAVFERMDLKKQIFGELGTLTKPGTVLATNTSSLDVNEIAEASGRPGDVLGMHFFSPANVMKLLEVVRGDKTDPDALATAIEVGRRSGKIPVTVGVCFGFVGNRMMAARTRQLDAMLLEGASPAEIDAEARRFGNAMGPCAVSDLAGLDVGYLVRKESGRRAYVIDAIAESGRHGQKTGKGLYRYDPGDRRPIPDPEVDTFIDALALQAGVTRRPIPDDEIGERLVYPMINEAARILEEGIAARPSDIDLIWISGYGFPRTKGGPMFHADTIGLPTIVARLDELAERTGSEELHPAPLLRRLAEQGGSFGDMNGS
ncbi:3-hydroxyacyl-CoA dehydrogenase NAD-binding domain-containing protein [Paracoccus sp. S1E-3]|uniref:3-hydroxyacyl-CoA dehydrogenase NAD-binding domain-containing protein n=1 Tax=Paracoccus sp. S1E-3 TaxID=2756130 RepID=UPI0015EE68FE|nr:3-hydroxyacyl-CoA dehydrogenase NAD-binding domain-containing protein [Paracoccus sp. S1E-3]MBA4489607.1 enoyl-CoA hydratase/isomerase family protein [Paracoccus sp. S1E-3]